MIYSSHCQNQGEEIYICFHLSKIQLLQENPTVRCSCYEFYFGKVIAFGKIQIGEICWKSPGQNSKKGFHRSLNTFVCSAVLPIIDTASLFCFVEACVDATEHNQECQTNWYVKTLQFMYTLSGKFLIRCLIYLWNLLLWRTSHITVIARSRYPLQVVSLDVTF